MKELFSISQTAKMVDTTAETLRHYDRIGLVKPFHIDEWTGYRYYSNQEVVRLNTIRALRCMDLTLQEIKQILDYNDFEKIIKALEHAEKIADEKVEAINYAKAKITKAREFYKSKLKNQNNNNDIHYIKEFDKRIILLSNELQSPSIENLFDYHRHFYSQIGLDKKDYFTFDDLAGVYIEQNKSSLFAVCNKYINIDGLKTLPNGKYLCIDCSEENFEISLENLKNMAKKQYNVIPQFILKIIVLSGILKWNYQIQIYIGN